MTRSGPLPRRSDKRYTRGFCKLLILRGRLLGVYPGVCLTPIIRIGAYARAIGLIGFTVHPGYTIHPRALSLALYRECSKEERWDMPRQQAAPCQQFRPEEEGEEI